MSLLDMINFNLGHFLSGLRLLNQEIRVALERAASTPDAIVQPEDMTRLQGNFGYVAQTCARMNLNHADARLGVLVPNYAYIPNKLPTLN